MGYYMFQCFAEPDLLVCSCCVGVNLAYTLAHILDKPLGSQHFICYMWALEVFLGAAESGKSTVLKQMRILHSSGFPRHERQLHATIIRGFALDSLSKLCYEMHRLGLIFEATERQWDEVLLKQECELRKFTSEALPYSEELFFAIGRLWQDGGVQSCFRRSDEFQFNVSAKYFLDDLNRIGDSAYVPTQDDILRVRVPTMSIVECNFEIQNRFFRVFDVGGQQSQRRKWFHVFDNLVSAIIFIAAVSEYNQLEYDYVEVRRVTELTATTKRKFGRAAKNSNESVYAMENNTEVVAVSRETTVDVPPNRLHESLRLFKSICRNELFKNTTMILFLNKIDLFEEKIGKVPLTCAFQNYAGCPSYFEGLEYIKNKFLSVDVSNKKRDIFPHYTCATDTKQIEVVDSAVIQTILCDNMKDMGITN